MEIPYLIFGVIWGINNLFFRHKQTIINNHLSNPPAGGRCIDTQTKTNQSCVAAVQNTTNIANHIPLFIPSHEWLG